MCCFDLLQIINRVYLLFLFSCQIVSTSVISRTVACQASLSFTISRNLLKLMSIESLMLSNHLILCCPLLLLPSIFPGIKVFSTESALHVMWPKYWSFSFSVSPSNEYSGLISFRIDWLDLLADQGTLKSILQCSNSKASVLWHSAFFMVQLLHPYMTTGKIIALTRWTFVSKVMALLFNMLSCLENPRDREPGGLLSMGSHRVGNDWSDLAAAAAEYIMRNAWLAMVHGVAESDMTEGTTHAHTFNEVLL